MTPHRSVFYDADCGLCRWVAAKLLSWDRRHALRLIELQNREAADRLLGGMADEERMASWHLVEQDGQVYSGGEALPPLLRLLPGGRPLAAIAAKAQPATKRAYRFVADHRTPFSRLVPQGAKRRADERLARQDP